MKIFATVMLVMIALTTTNVSSLPQNGYNYNAQMQPLIMQILAESVQQQAPPPPQPQYQAVSQPSPRYAQSSPAVHLSASFPMPASFPAPSPSIAAPAPLQSTRQRYRPRVKIPKKPIVTKNFFIHSAPEDTDADLQEEISQMEQQPRKHYNVLFVKTPSQTSKAAALKLASALKEEKTVVYVLSKKTTAAELQAAISEAPQHINKPEVFFIKYRTPEEAAHAQRQIQSQYDSFGGTSIISDEGLAPVTSVVGSLDAPEEEEIDDHQQLLSQTDEQLVNSINNIGGSDGGAAGGSGSTQYLPPNRRY